MFIVSIIRPSWDRNNFIFPFKNSLTENGLQTVNSPTLWIFTELHSLFSFTPLPVVENLDLLLIHLFHLLECVIINGTHYLNFFFGSGLFDRTFFILLSIFAVYCWVVVYWMDIPQFLSRFLRQTRLLYACICKCSYSQTFSFYFGRH